MNIKLVSTTVTLALTTLFTANAQKKDDAFIGPKLGMNIAMCTNSDGADARVGLMAGIQGQYFFTNSFALHGEVLYSQQGAKEKEDGVSATLKLDYLNIPVLAKFYPQNAGGFNVYAGPQFGFAVNKKAKAKIGSSSMEVSVADEVNTFDFGIAMGLGYDFAFGLTTDFRWTPSISYIFNGDSFDNEENSRNSVISLSVGWKF